MPKEEDRKLLRPTIVGGQPSGQNSRTVGIPRGVEALIKKASVDPEFRRLLLEKRADAAQNIDLELTAGEACMLNSIPQAQIELIINKTTVPDEHRRVFLGKVGAAMIALLSLELAACLPITRGITPEGIRPDLPEQPTLGILPDDPSVRRKPKPELRAGSNKQLLEVKVSETGRNSVSLPVKYDCPFDKATLKIFFADKDKKEAEDVLCRPQLALVSKGTGEITFQSSAKRGSTEWILLRLSDSNERCRDQAPVSIAELLSNEEPQEYRVGKCSVWHIKKFHKKWKA